MAAVTGFFEQLYEADETFFMRIITSGYHACAYSEFGRVHCGYSLRPKMYNNKNSSQRLTIFII